MKLYTKGGDSGSTSLVGGERVSKDDIRVEAYGSIDELTAFIGLLTDKIRQGIETEESNKELYGACCDDLVRINSTLMSIEAHLAAGEGYSYKLPTLGEESVVWLEGRIDALQEPLPQITKFTIPGGDQVVSLCHVCRTICRRAERRSISVARQGQLDDNVIGYLNRLSDYLYLLGRATAHLLDVEEILWRPEK